MLKNLLKTLFPRSGATWLIWWTLLYTVVVLYSVFVEPVASIELIQAGWLLVCSLPLWIPPLAKFLRMKVLWK